MQASPLAAHHSALTPVPPATPLQQDAATIGLVAGAHACSHFAHLLLPPLFAVFAVEFNLSFTQLGLLMTLFFVVSGSGQLISGFVVDRVGARPILFASFVCFIGACLAGSVAQGYGGLMLVALLAGMGNAPFHPVDFSILNQRVSAARLGYGFSAHGLAGNLGWALAPAFFAFMTSFTNWRNAYLTAACGYAVVLAVLVLNGRKLKTRTAAEQAAAKQAQQASVAASTAPGATATQASVDAEVRQSVFAYLKLPVVWWCFAFFFLTTVMLSVIQNYSSPILSKLFGASPTVAAMTITAYMTAGAVGMFMGGFVVAKHPKASDKVVSVCMTAGALLVALCATGWLGATGTMALLAATGFAVGIGGPSRDMMIKKATPSEATGRVYGTVYSGLDIGFAVSPLIFGTLMDAGWYRATLAGAALALLLSVYTAIGVGKRTPKA
ncbi:MFS transporter [Comamonas serinivorans]|uniref:MFS transporter n=1 Tax=Comamonas serinivorans TaxID=1082851 RepID=A0A1Y0ETV8_9BURK|nr:MFS transporter [Comamonas serinivorans]ARU06702.1 MFS transporter [Comamonas serinivorans]